MADLLFDSFAAQYDEWFDSAEGRRIFALEVDCLRSLMNNAAGRWLEVGVGTGRFAEALGIREGIDPAKAVLEFAARRHIRVKTACAEDLPYPDASLDGVLMVVTICFVADPARAFEECRRALKGDGRVIVGLVPADSPWGELYARKGREGHRFYSAARFYTCDQVVRLAADAGLTFCGARSCLFTLPGEPAKDRSIREGIVAHAGFVALELAQRPATKDRTRS